LQLNNLWNVLGNAFAIVSGNAEARADDSHQRDEVATRDFRARELRTSLDLSEEQFDELEQPIVDVWQENSGTASAKQQATQLRKPRKFVAKSGNHQHIIS
jgi:hypothetical protein